MDQDLCTSAEAAGRATKPAGAGFEDALVVVLMATYNGDRFLDQQLETLAAQTVSQIDVRVSDDGSSDRTLDILESWRNRWEKGEFTIVRGPSKGFAENFRSLLMLRDMDGDYFAFCDQDDLWDAEKLEVAVTNMVVNAADRPGLYCSRTRIVTEAGGLAGASPLFARPASFRNAIVQNIGGGNTMVLNRKAWDLVSRSVERTSFISHDWWCYLMVSGVGGYVFYDPQPRIGYRQHAENLVGDNMTPKARLDRLKRLMTGRFADWNAANVEGLERCADLLADDAKRVLADFKAIRSSRYLDGAARFFRSGIYRQSKIGNLALLIAIILGRL